jgi:hypothetical protein
LGGMQSMAYMAPYVYLIPFLNGTYSAPKAASKIVRYDTSKPLGSASSYETFDLATLAAPGLESQLNGFTGGIPVGKNLVLVPWGSRNLSKTNSVALLFDTTQPLADKSAWQVMDLTTVDPKAGGYQFGWLDRNGYVWFVPTHNYDGFKPAIPPFIAWNSQVPFTCASSWKSYPDSQPIWSCGAAYDPATNTAWLSPYGEPAGGSLVASITQLQEMP